MQILSQPVSSKDGEKKDENPILKLSELVREKTLSGLTATSVLKEAESDAFRDYMISNEVSSGEILPLMAQLRGIDEKEHTATVGGWGRSLAPVVKRRYSLVPFAGRLMGSSTFFEKHPKAQEAAKAIMCPLVFAEDTDVVGFATINPVAGVAMADFVTRNVRTKSGATPYVSMFTLELNEWQELCKKQFGHD